MGATEAVLDSLEQALTVIEAGKDDPSKHLEPVEFNVASAYCRSFEAVFSAFQASTAVRPNFVSFLLRAYSLSVNAFSPQPGASVDVSFVGAAIKTILNGAHFAVEQLSTDVSVAGVGTANEIRLLSGVCWNTALMLRTQGFPQLPAHIPPASDLFLVAFDLQTTASNMCRAADPTFLPESSDDVNSVGMLTMAASDVINRCLATSGESYGDRVDFGQLMKTALQWVCKAQGIIKSSKVRAMQDETEIAADLNPMSVTLALLRLMAGINGISISSEVDEANLSAVIAECAVELTAIPAEVLRAAATSAKNRGLGVVSAELLEIAIRQGESPAEQSELHTRSSFMLPRLYCDLFFVSPSIEACLQVADKLLHSLQSYSGAESSQVLDE